jgi:hypothetical protein
VLQPVSSVTNKSVIPEVFYRESIAKYGFPIKDFGNDERLVGYELTGCNTRHLLSTLPAITNPRVRLRFVISKKTLG